MFVEVSRCLIIPANPFYRAYIANLTLTGNAHCTVCTLTVNLICLGLLCMCPPVDFHKHNKLDVPSILDLLCLFELSVQHVYHRSSDALRVWHKAYTAQLLVMHFSIAGVQNRIMAHSEIMLFTRKLQEEFCHRNKLIFHSSVSWLVTDNCPVSLVLPLVCFPTAQISKGSEKPVDFCFAGCVSWLEHIFFTNVNSSQDRKRVSNLELRGNYDPEYTLSHFQYQMEMLSFASHLQITFQNQAQNEKITTTSMPFSPFQVNTESCSCQRSDESWLPSIQRALGFFPLQTFNLLAGLTEKL